MRPNNPEAARLVAATLGKGCLAGLGLAGVFFVISSLMYLILSGVGLPHNILLLLTIASGPILGTGIAFTVLLLVRPGQSQRQVDGTQSQLPPAEAGGLESG